MNTDTEIILLRIINRIPKCTTKIIENELKGKVSLTAINKASLKLLNDKCITKKFVKCKYRYFNLRTMKNTNAAMYYNEIKITKRGKTFLDKERF